MEEKKKKRYFCDFWKKVRRPEDYTIKFLCELSGIFLISIAIGACLHRIAKVEWDEAMFIGCAISLAFYAIIIIVGDIAAKKSEKNKQGEKRKKRYFCDYWCFDNFYCNYNCNRHNCSSDIKE